MAYSREFVEKVRDAWLSGQFSNMAALARHFSFKNVARIYAWRKRDRWDELEKKVKAKLAETSADLYAERAAQLNDTFWKLWGVIISFVTRRIQQSMSEEDPAPITLTDMETITRIIARAQQGQALTVSTAMLPEDDGVSAEVVIRYESLVEAIERTQGIGGNGGNRKVAGGNGGNGGAPTGGEGVVIGGGDG